MWHGLVAAAIAALAVIVTSGPAPAQAIAQTSPDQTINVQLINVCASDGTQCALSGPYANYGYNPAAIEQIFAQAGITVNLLSPVNYDNSAYLNPAVIDDPANGYTTGSPTDPAHQLLDLPGHDQNTDPNVLNVFLVNSLPHSTAQGAAASTLYGLGLQNANGAVVTTGLIYNNGVPTVAGIDNIAHELGHNLGLTHVDTTSLAGTTVAAGPLVTLPAPPGTYANPIQVDTPFNLLNSSSRNVPRTVCGIIGTVCDANGNVVPAGSPNAATTGAKDVLLPFQTQTLQQSAADLFTVDDGSATASVNTANGGCQNGSSNCTVIVSTGPLAPGQSLVGLKVRFLGSPDIDFNGYQFVTSVGDCTFQDVNNALAAGGQEIGLTTNPGCLGSDSGLILQFAGEQDSDLAPFSFEFDFSDGVTSEALFDSTGTAHSANPFALGDLNTPDQNGPALPVPTDPALFNAESILEDTGFTVLTDVPEPAAVAMLAAGVLAVIAGRRRTA